MNSFTIRKTVSGSMSLNKKMIKWIFFDVGSTLIDETKAYDHRARDMIKGTQITFEQFDKMRIALARKGLDGNSAAIDFFGLEKTPWHSEDELPYPEAETVLKNLCEKGYRLGVIANQNSGLDARLEKWGLRKYFTLLVSSAEIGCAKPDLEIFKRAFAMANSKADECVMIGDRLDNDVRPAKAIGMKSVWIRNGLARHQSASLGDGIADLVINSLIELISVF